MKQWVNRRTLAQSKIQRIEKKERIHENEPQLLVESIYSETVNSERRKLRTWSLPLRLMWF